MAAAQLQSDCILGCIDRGVELLSGVSGDGTNSTTGEWWIVLALEVASALHALEVFYATVCRCCDAQGSALDVAARVAEELVGIFDGIEARWGGLRSSGLGLAGRDSEVVQTSLRAVSAVLRSWDARLRLELDAERGVVVVGGPAYAKRLKMVVCLQRVRRLALVELDRAEKSADAGMGRVSRGQELAVGPSTRRHSVVLDGVIQQDRFTPEDDEAVSGTLSLFLEQLSPSQLTSHHHSNPPQPTAAHAVTQPSRSPSVPSSPIQPVPANALDMPAHRPDSPTLTDFTAHTHHRKAVAQPAFVIQTPAAARHLSCATDPDWRAYTDIVIAANTANARVKNKAAAVVEREVTSDDDESTANMHIARAVHEIGSGESESMRRRRRREEVKGREKRWWLARKARVEGGEDQRLGVGLVGGSGQQQQEEEEEGEAVLVMGLGAEHAWRGGACTTTTTTSTRDSYYAGRATEMALRSGGFL
jgi:hypothetical protein